MNTPVQFIGDVSASMRRRVPDQPALRALAMLSNTALAVAPGTRDLAAPPRGSGLAAVPGDPGPPLVGYTFLMMRDPVGGVCKRFERYGPVSWSGAFGID